MRRSDRSAASSAGVPSSRRAGLALAAGLVLWLAPGCVWLDQLTFGKEAGIHAISLHYFAESSTDVSGKTQMIRDANGAQQFCISRAPIVSNRQIMEGELEDSGDPERPALRLRLDRQGSMLWLQACQDTPGDRVAVLLDGFFWYAMRLPRPTDTRSILIDGPIGRTEAEAIVEAIPRHYKRYNPSPGLL